MSPPGLALADIELAAGVLAPLVRETPAWVWRDELTERLLAPGTQVVLKLELFQ